MPRELEPSVRRVEAHLGALGSALREHDAEAVAAHAAEVQHALAQAVELVREGGGRVPPPLRQRLALAAAHIAAQRESLARASAALDRAIDVLLPGATPRGAYSASGIAERRSHSGCVQA
jgi:outer membrane PBP1 activator LpoA protein